MNAGLERKQIFYPLPGSRALVWSLGCVAFPAQRQWRSNLKTTRRRLLVSVRTEWGYDTSTFQISARAASTSSMRCHVIMMHRMCGHRQYVVPRPIIDHHDVELLIALGPSSDNGTRRRMPVGLAIDAAALSTVTFSALGLQSTPAKVIRRKSFKSLRHETIAQRRCLMV